MTNNKTERTTISMAESRIHTAGSNLIAGLKGRIAFWRLLTEFVCVDSAAIRVQTNSANMLKMLCGSIINQRQLIPKFRHQPT
jgi:hypothetical protein